MICLRCNKEHDGNFGSGKFCSRFCANQRIHTKETLSKISNKLSGRVYGSRTPIPDHICIKCGISFKKKIRKDRKIVCNDCIRKVIHVKTGDFSLTDLSTRTISKIFKRANLGCAICGWKESSCDLHHVIERSKAGSDELDNLIYICPNHHRIIHVEGNIDKKILKERTLDKILPNWKDFYNI